MSTCFGGFDFGDEFRADAHPRPSKLAFSVHSNCSVTIVSGRGDAGRYHSDPADGAITAPLVTLGRPSWRGVRAEHDHSNTHAKGDEGSRRAHAMGQRPKGF
jgi:hypothetical protein